MKTFFWRLNIQLSWNFMHWFLVQKNKTIAETLSLIICLFFSKFSGNLWLYTCKSAKFCCCNDWSCCFRGGSCSLLLSCLRPPQRFTSVYWKMGMQVMDIQGKGVYQCRVVLRRPWLVAVWKIGSIFGGGIFAYVILMVFWIYLCKKKTIHHCDCSETGAISKYVFVTETFLPLLGFEPGFSGTTVQHSTNQAKGLT